MAAVQTLAEAGSASAWFDLGEFHASGEAGAIDGAAAIAAYEKAAEAGSVAALVKLGIIYRDGTLAEADPARSLATLQKAAEAGSASARFTIAKGYVLGQFGDAGTIDQGIAMLQELKQSGVGDAALVLSDSYFSGRGVARDPERALAVLDEAADDGSVMAARRLIALYRDGRGKAVKRDVARAREYFSSVSDQLDEHTRGIEAMLIGAASANTVPAYDTVRTSLYTIEGDERPALVGKIRNTNVNVYVYLVQARLAELGTYDGKPNGRLDRDTIRAIRAWCADNDMASACAPGPLSQSAVQAMLPML
jgi:TPR repeat protein